MTRSFLALVTAVLLGSCGNSPASPSDAPQVPSEQLQAVINEWAAVPGHYGVSASVIHADGTQWSGVAGRAGSGPLQPNHLIAIASITKTMVGALMLQMADESKLSLDDPISRWLPEREYVDPDITIRQLLNHTNGLDNYTTKAAVGQEAAANLSRVFTADELLAFIGPPHFAPGTATEYTNTAFVLLGQIAERAAGKSAVTLLNERLWNPLGLSEVFLPGHESSPGAAAVSLTSFGVLSPLERMSTLSIGHTAFGLMASGRNVARWGHELFTGTVVSGRMQQEMRTMVPAAGNIPGESGAGLGIRGYSYLGRLQIGHSGGSSFGNSLLLHDPAARVTVAVLMNQGQGADHFTLAPALLNLALRR
jgi:D-alanyl-D-alanine carboxypeptidase